MEEPIKFREKEDWFVLKDGMKLFEKTWEPITTPQAHLIFLHGFSDRSEIQYYLFPTLASAPYNIACHAIDQRGWGKSVHQPFQRGLTGSTSRVLADIDEYVNYVSTSKIQNARSTPLFLMGHSMGGQEVLHYLLSSSTLTTASRWEIAGAIVEAPYIELDPTSQPSSLLIAAGKVAAMITPKSQMKQYLDSKYITQDPAVNKAWKDDALCHDYGTLEGLRDMLARGAALVQLTTLTNDKKSTAKARQDLGLRSNFEIPIFWAHGTADRIIAFGPSKRLFDCLNGPQKVGTSKTLQGTTFKAYEGAYHKIHAEPNGVGIEFAKDVGDWVSMVVAAKPKAWDPADAVKAAPVRVNGHFERGFKLGGMDTMSTRSMLAGDNRSQQALKLVSKL